MLTLFGVADVPEFARLWLGLAAVIVALKIILMVRLVRWRIHLHPSLALYMTVSLFEMARYTAHWGWRREAFLSFCFACASIEAVFLSTWINGNGWRIWERVCILGIGILVVGVAILMTPAPYPNWPSETYYANLYPTIACWAALIGALGYCATQKRLRSHPYIWNNVILAILASAFFWADMQNDAALKQRNSIVVEIILIGCLILWHLTLPRWDYSNGKPKPVGV